MRYAQLNVREVAVNQIHVAPGNQTLWKWLAESRAYFHSNRLAQRGESAQQSARAHVRTEQAQLRAGRI